ncbi:MAG: amino acid ABC transporter permease [Verrucomicrobiota bacterium]
MRSYLPSLVIISSLLALVVFGASQLNYTWQWGEIPQYLAENEDGTWYRGALIYGLTETVKISSLSLASALLGGLLLAGGRTHLYWSLRIPSEAFFKMVRNTPLLVQLYVTYFIFGPILDLDRFWVAVLSLSAFHAAYLAPIFQSGLDSIPKGQAEAAQSLGLPKLNTYLEILLPQALRVVLPACTNEAVNLIKNSALLSAIAIFELTTEGKDIVADTFMSFEIWLTVGALYLLITIPLSSTAIYLEKRLKS